jgi:hypothetical protein
MILRTAAENLPQNALQDEPPFGKEIRLEHEGEEIAQKLNRHELSSQRCFIISGSLRIESSARYYEKANRFLAA